MDEVELTRKFIFLMKPLVPKGKLALEIIGAPSRKNEIDSLKEIISIAKKTSLHRDKKHSLASITINYKIGENSFHGNHIILKIDSLRPEDYTKRFVMIVILIVTVVTLILTTRR